MTIQYHGDACVRLSGKIGPQEYTILLDPYDAKATGLTAIRPSAVDLVCSTTGAFPEFAEGPYRVTGPGEYEVRSVMVTGIGVGDRTVYRIDAEEVTVAHLGNVGVKLDAATLEALGDIDVLLIPVGGHPGGAGSGSAGGVLTAKQAGEVIEEIEPRIVIPIQYKVTSAKLPYDGVEGFCKEMGCSAKTTEEKLKVVAKDLPQDATRVVLLSVS